MAEETKEDAPAPEAPKAPRRLKLAVRSDGTPGGTHLVDAETGEALAFDGQCHAEVRGDPRQGGTASVRLVFDGLGVDAGAAQAPFHLVGATLGHAPPPAGTPLGMPTPAAPTPQGLPTPGASGSAEQARAWNDAMNAGRQKGPPR
jgi:hypothetical protein